MARSTISSAPPPNGISCASTPRFKLSLRHTAASGAKAKIGADASGRTIYLILDDSLSAVDTDTESRILAALKSRRPDQTTIIIAHRLSSVMHADKIIVLGDGKVVQEGTHASLSQVPGNYQHLCEIQGAIQRQIEADISDTEQSNV